MLAGLTGGGIAVGYAVGSGRGGVIDEALRAIETGSKSEVSRATLQRAAIEGMLRAAGDGYGTFWEPGKPRGFTPGSAGNFTGVGVWLGTDDNGDPIIGGVFRDSPAETAGVRAGDLLIAVDGQPVVGLGGGDITNLLQGDQGTSVVLTVKRGNTKSDVRITREFQVASALNIAQLKGGLLYIQPGPLVEGVANQIGLKIQEGDQPKGVLLDLRGNPGGLIDEGIALASVFLDGGPVAIYRQRGEAPQKLNAPFKGDSLTPMVVLTDRDTASSAEIVAAALKARNRAVMVGLRTQGKAAVQKLVPLSNSSAIQQTVGEYRSPTDERVDGVGVDPDVRLSIDSTSEESLREALSVLRGLMRARSTLEP
jgi:carboxyl-terminal processing protease